ncbi:MAG: flagellar basal body rod protein FlgB [Cellulosilyticaceae bacterium]
MFHSINIMNKALDATMLRVNTLTNNIANVETPGFKREDVSFEQKLIDEIEKKGVKGVELDAIEGNVYTDYVGYASRMDGNNVDIDREMGELAKTKLRYDVMIQRTSAQIGRYKYILQNIK